MNFDVFGFGKIQDFSTLLDMAVSEGTTDIRLIQQQLHDYLTNKRKETYVSAKKAKKKKIEAKPKQNIYRGLTMCLMCESDQYPALVERVNICPSTMIGGRWKSSISCTNPACLHIELSEKTVAEVIK